MIENLDPVLLSRIQFALLFRFTFFSGLHDRSGQLAGGARVALAENRRAVYAEIYRMWVKIFAVTFGMGVVSGVVMSFQFGTNWSRILGQSRKCARPAAGLRSADRIFSRGLISRGDAVWLEPRQPPDAFCRNRHCRRSGP